MEKLRFGRNLVSAFQWKEPSSGEEDPLNHNGFPGFSLIKKRNLSQVRKKQRSAKQDKPHEMPNASTLRIHSSRGHAIGPLADALAKGPFHLMSSLKLTRASMWSHSWRLFLVFFSSHRSSRRCLLRLGFSPK